MAFSQGMTKAHSPPNTCSTRNTRLDVFPSGVQGERTAGKEGQDTPQDTHLLHNHGSQVPEDFTEVGNGLHDLTDLPLPFLHHQCVLFYQDQLVIRETLSKQESPC